MFSPLSILHRRDEFINRGRGQQSASLVERQSLNLRQVVRAEASMF
jgi:hypothetical protein